MLSILATAPVILQRLVEGTAGQVDFRLFPGMLAAQSLTLNDTAVTSVLTLDDHAPTGHHAPRVVLGGLITRPEPCAGAAPGAWWYENGTASPVCTDTAVNCLQNHCDALLMSSVTVMAFDAFLEGRMGYNAAVHLPELRAGETLYAANCHLHRWPRVCALGEFQSRAVPPPCAVHHSHSAVCGWR